MAKINIKGKAVENFPPLGKTAQIMVHLPR